MLSTLMLIVLGSLVGRIAQGTAKANQQIKAIDLRKKLMKEDLQKYLDMKEQKVPIEQGEAEI